MRDVLLRVQDASGRGPWRPGFSATWVDSWRTEALPPIYTELPDFQHIVEKAHKSRLHVGCAVRGTDKIRQWFSWPEISRLFSFGFYIADATECEVLAETAHQVMIASPRKLNKLPAFIVHDWWPIFEPRSTGETR